MGDGPRKLWGGSTAKIIKAPRGRHCAPCAWRPLFLSCHPDEAQLSTLNFLIDDLYRCGAIQEMNPGWLHHRMTLFLLFKLIWKLFVRVAPA